MKRDGKGLWIGGVAAILLCAGVSARAQENEAIIGPPQLKDFSLQPRERIVTQPETPPATTPRAAAPRAPVTVAPGPPVTRPAPASRTTAEARPAATAPPRTGSAAPQASPGATAPSPVSSAPPTAMAFPPPAETIPAPPAATLPGAPADQDQGPNLIWLFGLAVGLGLLGFAVLRRRQAGRLAFASEPAIAPVAPAPPRKPRPDPVPRPWLELELRAERAAFTADEAEISFELEISNKGGSAARNLRIDVKMFNAGAEQDKEIGAFFRTAGRESAKLKLPGVKADVTGIIRGSVGMKREDIRAMRLDERLLFIPVVAVNILYDWGEGRTGQTSRSYLVGRELQEPSERMGAFRVDLGPRIWRTVGQRPHKLAKRV